MVFLSIWGGALADRLPKRTILVWTQTASMLVAFLLAALVWMGDLRTWEIMVLSALGGVIMAFDMPARQSFLIEMTSREDLLNAISLNSSIFNGARLVGPSLAGFVMAKSGAAACFFLNGVSFVAVIVSLLRMRISAVSRPPHGAPHRPDAWSGLRYVRQHTRVRTIMALIGVVGVFGWSYGVLMPAIARDVLHLDERGYGFLLTASSIGALAATLLTASASERFTPRTLALGGLWLFSLVLIVFAFARSFSLAFAALVVIGFGMMLFFATSNTTVQTIVPDEMRGRVMGVWSLIFGAMIPLGGLEAGAFAHWFGPTATIAGGAVICAAAGVVATLVIRRRESTLASSPPPP
jgi:MFS family permease